MRSADTRSWGFTASRSASTHSMALSASPTKCCRACFDFHHSHRRQTRRQPVSAGAGKRCARKSVAVAFTTSSVRSRRPP